MLDKIADGIRKVNELVAEIATSSNEQAQGFSLISAAVGQMDQVTQSNAANAEESASAAEELSAQAEDLHRSVAELQMMVGGSGHASLSGGVPATPAMSRPQPAPAPQARKQPQPHAQPAPAPRREQASDAGEVDVESVLPLDDHEFADL